MTYRVDIQSVFRPAPITTGEAGLSMVGEPTVARNGDQILMAGNWYAARSIDGGASWEALDPYNYLDPGPSTGFCCDQSAYYDAAHDLTVWVLQYGKSAHDNTLRIAAKRGATLGQDDWFFWDLTTTTVDATWTDQWFDYNHVAATAEHLFVGSNVFGIRDRSIFHSVILRIPFASIISSIDSGSSLQFDYFEAGDSSTLRCTLGAGDTMYVAGQIGNDTLRVFTWPDASPGVTSVDVKVSPWLDSSYSAPGPDGNNWLKRCDDRITGAWVANGRIGLMWSANMLGSQRPRPYVRVVVLEAATMSVVREPDIWSTDHAYAYPDACPNEEGVVGVTLFRGGGTTHPGQVVGGYDDGDGTWGLSVAVDGTNGPEDEKWGDYLTCRANGGNWIAAGFTLQGGATLADVQPDLVVFDLL